MTRRIAMIRAFVHGSRSARRCWFAHGGIGGGSRVLHVGGMPMLSGILQDCAAVRLVDVVRADHDPDV